MRILNAAVAYNAAIIEENNMKSVSKELSGRSAKLLIGAIAAIAIASAVSVLPAVCGTTIYLALKISTVCVLTQGIGRLFNNTLLYGEELRKKGSELACFPLYIVVPVFSCLSELQWRGVVFPILKAIVSIVASGPLVGTIAAVATSALEAMSSWEDGDVWDGLGKLAASQLLFFPIYFAGGLPAAILAHAVYNLVTNLTDRYRFVHAMQIPPYLRAAQAFCS